MQEPDQKQNPTFLLVIRLTGGFNRGVGLAVMVEMLSFYKCPLHQGFGEGALNSELKKMLFQSNRIIRIRKTN